MDVLSASRINDNIDWYENLGNGNFSSTKIIYNFANGARSVYAADLDGDGDKDVLSAAWDDDEIAWYENLGSCNFSSKNGLSFINNPTGVYAADLDGDGDMDILASTSFEMCWYENLGNSNFSTKNTFSGSTSSSSVISSIRAADIDLDGDMDVITASMGNNRVSWHENLGSGTFSFRNIIASNVDASAVHAADIDGDGDLDVLSSSWGESKISWYENSSITTNRFEVVFCDTGSYTLPSGVTYNVSGIYNDTLPNAFGGDSIITVDLQLNAWDSVAFQASFCAGDTVYIGNIPYTQAGLYTDTLTNIHGCDSVIFSDIEEIQVYATTTVSGSNISADSVLTGYSYQWIDCADGSLIPNATSSSFSPVSSGDYAVIVTSDGCSDTSSCQMVLNNFGLSESILSDLTIYPNPSKDILNIELGITAEAEIKLRDVFGKLHYEKRYSQTDAVYLSIAKYAEGMYFIEVLVNGERQVRSVVKQ